MLLLLRRALVPDGLNAAGEVLQGTFDEDHVNVLLLQLLVHHVNVRHDKMKKLQEKTEIFVLQHPQEARCLPHCGVVK